MTPTDFIARWKNSGGAEIANSQSFLKELCDLIGVPHPEPTQPDEDRNTYVFEKAVKIGNGDGTEADGRLDLYRKGSFVLESKQGTERREAEADEALATVTKAKKRRKGHAERGSSMWTLVMTRARKQAERYAQAIPGEWPPFLIVVDVGHCLQLYADFTQSGKNYQPFPDPASYEIRLADLEREEIRQQLRAIWLDPLSLDPSRISAKVTRQLAERLAKLAKLMEGKYEPKVVAEFLMRCLFTMFAEDMEIGGFKTNDLTNLLKDCRADVESFVPMMESLWSEMNTGHRMSGWLRRKIAQFNGGLFEDSTALPVTADQLELLIESSEARWNDVEPAIFGTLLERALDPVERHKLGAHYTPRAYVERLVMPTIIEPLREEWASVFAAASNLYEAEDAKNDKQRKESRTEAVSLIRNFHQKLCETTVLDPACGSGNFLYVAMELMKRLEGEVLNALRDFGGGEQALVTIDPHQFKGIEVNPRAASITDLVLWIGYLQWHSRTLGKNAPIKEPIIKRFHNIECRDAVLAWDAIEPVVDEAGNPVTRWDGRTMKTHPVTGEDVPDETARVQELRYINPRKAEWPQADYIVGNPPFIGDKRMREALGYGYVLAIRSLYEVVPESADYVMYWWNMAAGVVISKSVRRFGFIATNSLKQAYNRRVLDTHMSQESGLSLAFAIPDHPWVDSSDGAAVRISMTVAVAGRSHGVLWVVTTETDGQEDSKSLVFCKSFGEIQSSLRIGANVHQAKAIKGNIAIAHVGVALHARGLALSGTEASRLLNASIDANVAGADRLIRPTKNAKDVAQTSRNAFVLDLFDLDEPALRATGPIFQHVLNFVRPERSQNNRLSYRKYWWKFGEPRPEMRRAITGLHRYIITPLTAVHRYFIFFDPSVIPDQALVVIALDDPFYLAVLSSRIHVLWATTAGGRLGVGNDPRYNKTLCFDPFPFPDATERQQQRIRELGEQLDAHRKRQQLLHPDLTMTGMYNVLEKLREIEAAPRAGSVSARSSANALQDQTGVAGSGGLAHSPASGDTRTGPSSKPSDPATHIVTQTALTAKERKIHDDGLVSVLKQIHDDLDAAVFDAYGWPATLTDEEILERLVALNHERAAEEAAGKIRWLRPEFQNPQTGEPAKTQQTFEEAEEEEDEESQGAKRKGKKKAAPKVAKTSKAEWPATLPERIRAVRQALTTNAKPATATDIAGQFSRANKAHVAELLETLVAVGQARVTAGGEYAP